MKIYTQRRGGKNSRNRAKEKQRKVKFNTDMICWGKLSSGVGKKEASRKLCCVCERKSNREWGKVNLKISG